MSASKTPESLENGVICLKFKKMIYDPDTDNPDRFIFEYKGKIIFRDEDGVDYVIGKFIAAVANVENMINNEIHPYDAFDCEGSYFDYYEELFNTRGQLSRKVTSAIGSEWNLNVLIIGMVVVNRAFRGRSFGLKAIRAIIERLGLGTGFVVLKAFPLQAEARFKEGENRDSFKAMGLDQFTMKEDKAISKLIRHYRKLGFKKLHGSEFMVRSMEMRLPEI